MGSASNHQHPLTVVAKVPGSRQALVDDLASCNERVLARLAEVDTLHYARFVVFEGNDGAARLAFESNYDGDEASHLHELEQRLGTDLEVILGHCRATPGATSPASSGATGSCRACITAPTWG